MKHHHLKARFIIALVLSFAFLAPMSAHAAPVYVFPVADCTVNYARAHHDYAATDILAKAGRQVDPQIDAAIRAKYNIYFQ